MLKPTINDRVPVGGCDRILTARCLGCPNCLRSGRVLTAGYRRRTTS